MNPIYLDYNATTPIDKDVADAMRPFLYDYFGNPSSSHFYGIKAKQAIEKAREQVGRFINCNSSEIVFTSGGTESNNYAIKGVALANLDKGNHIITSSIEHPAVAEVCKYLETQHDFDITIIPVNKYGIINPEDVAKAITNNTTLITIMHANNEVGSIQPIAEVARIARAHHVIFHTDAAQSIGKIPTDVKQLDIDLLSVAGHKLYAPKGIGAIYVKDGIQLEKLIHGAGHEGNNRAGTENVLEIVGLGMACECAQKHFEEHISHYQKMTLHLYKLLKEALPQIQINGHPILRLPNTLSIAFPNLNADALLSRLSGVAASAGAACHADGISISSVLTAMGVPQKYAAGTVRFSTGRGTTQAQIHQATKEIIDVVKTLESQTIS